MMGRKFVCLSAVGVVAGGVKFGRDRQITQPPETHSVLVSFFLKSECVDDFM